MRSFGSRTKQRRIVAITLCGTRTFISSMRRLLAGESEPLRSAGGTENSWHSITWRGSGIARIFWYRSRWWNGGVPYTIWYRMQPRLHTSLGRPSFSRSRPSGSSIASGDM